MKQIRLKNKVIKIEECCKCPLYNDEFDECCLDSPVVSYNDVFPTSCPLEDYVEVKMKTADKKIPDHVTIVFTTQEAVNAYEVLMAAVDYFRDRPSPGHDHMREHLNYVFEIIWSQFADQVVSVAQPKQYQTILEFREQNEGGV